MAPLSHSAGQNEILTSSDAMLLTEIAEALPYNFKLRTSGGQPFLEFDRGREFSDIFIGFSNMFIYEGILHVHLYVANIKIDLFTCSDVVGEVNKFIKKHMIIK